MNTTLQLAAGIISISVFSATGYSAEKHSHHSQYAGQQNRIIKTLSEDDIQQLTEGKGWGLAKAAELNGIPGPAHLLEMKKEIALSDSQIKKIQQLFDDMNRKARIFGKKLIQLEAELNQAFASKTVNKQYLQEKLTAIEEVRRDLRYVHLVTHLETPSILSPEQISKYNTLRGYNDDPCKSVPKGHNREMWLQHNNCK